MITEKSGNFFVLISDNHVEGKKCMYLLLKRKSYVQTDAITPNIVGQTMLGVVGSGGQRDATTPNNVGTCSALWDGYNPEDFGDHV